ncbi:MAG: DMT family transporter [Pseudomonadales bacterium]|nr:DMT family transporter [Pseudomonadales bacterium]
MSSSHSNMAFVYAFFMSLVAATAAAVIKYLAATVSVEFITFCQFAICLLVSIAVLHKKSLGIAAVLAIETSDRLTMFIRGVSGLLGFYAFYLAIENIPLVDATLLRHSSPLFVPLVAWLWLRNSTQLRSLAIILLGFAGVYIALQPDLRQLNPYHLIGLGSALCLAISMVSTNYLKKYDAAIVLFYYFLISVLGMLPLAVQYWQSVNLLQLLCIGYVGASIYIAMYLYNKAFTLSNASLVAPMTYLSIVHAGLLDWLIWQYLPSWLSLLGMAIVVACGLLTTLSGRAKSARA